MPRQGKRRSRAVLEVIATFKFIKAASLILGGFGAIGLLSQARADKVEAWLEALSLQPGHHFVTAIGDAGLRYLDLATPNKLRAAAVGAFLYAMVFIVEGVGLSLDKRWAEYLTVAVTASFLPLEVIAIAHHWSWLKLLTMVLNVLVVIYLVVRLRSEK